MNTEILKMLVDGVGWIDSANGEIRTFTENGEMAAVKWYGQGKQTFNGKYIVTIIYS